MEQKTSKRTRVLNVRQSKNGCNTCKQRRIKCDEVKPTCLRCQRSNRVCGGYPAELGSDSSSSTSRHSDSPPTEYSSPDSFNLIPWSDPEQRRLSELACTVLGSDPHYVQSPSNCAVFTCLLPQLSHIAPCVSSAAATFGAAYESVVLHKGGADAVSVSAKHYVHALQLMQNEISGPSNGYIPLLMASMLLAASETIQHHQRDALQHVMGAFTLFNLQDKEKNEENDDEQTSTASKSLMRSSEIDVLEDVFRSLDFHIATFAWGKQPFLKSRPLSESMLTSSKVEDLINDQPILVHSCLHFVAETSEEIYQRYNDLPFKLIHQQGQLISWLRIWLARFDQVLKVDTANSKPRCTPLEHGHLNLLKSQVLAILVSISNIKTPLQTSYDKYEREFEQILQCAEVVLQQTDTPKLPNTAPTLPPFSTSPGIIQPLFFLARKCRHSVHRRHAIALLRISGIEGPFNGDLEATVAQRMVEIEEDRPYHPTVGESEVFLSKDIPESRRIASCWRVSENDNTTFRKSIRLCRRKHASKTPEPGCGSTDTTIHWDIWEEHFKWDVSKAAGFENGTEEKHWQSLPEVSFWGEPELASMLQRVERGGLALDASGSSKPYQHLTGRQPVFEPIVSANADFIPC